VLYLLVIVAALALCWGRSRSGSSARGGPRSRVRGTLTASCTNTADLALLVGEALGGERPGPGGGLPGRLEHD